MIRSKTSMNGADRDHESGLFEYFSRAGFFQRLPELDPAARQVPLPSERFVRALHQDNAAVDEHDGADAEHRPVRICACQLPITLTTTRFLRCPSNSA